MAKRHYPQMSQMSADEGTKQAIETFEGVFSGISTKVISPSAPICAPSQKIGH